MSFYEKYGIIYTYNNFRKGGISMDEITYDKVEDEKSPEVKQLYWNIAFGLQEVDGLKPSKYMVELSEKHIKGEKTYQQVQMK